MAEGELTGVSSIMPQKRNPAGLVFLRAQASTVLGHAHTFLLLAHNVAAGMSDYKAFINPVQGDQPNSVMRELADLLARFAAVVASLQFDAARARAEVKADYSTTTELADTVHRTADVPFRVGHHFASELVSIGRGRGWTPAEIPYAEAQRVYAAAARKFGLAGDSLPLDETAFRTALSARTMVNASQGLGGPQPAEVARMLAAEQARIAADAHWLAARHADMTAAERALEEAFDRLRGGQQEIP
jgi:argininosuccinate lyase